MPIGFEDNFERLSVGLWQDGARHNKLTFTLDLALLHNMAVQAEFDLHGQCPAGNLLGASDDSNHLLVLKVGEQEIGTVCNPTVRKRAGLSHACDLLEDDEGNQFS